MLDNIKLVIFDIDGTLLDSVCFNTFNMNRTLEKMGYDYRVTEEIIRNNLGGTAEDFYKAVLDESCYSDWEIIRAENRAHIREAMAEYGHVFPGVIETFKTLYEEGFILVLYSNCSRLYLEGALEVTGVKPYVDYTECVKDNGLEKPELIKKILGLYKGLNALIVGDRIHDMEAAKINDIPYVAALYGFGKHEIEHATYKVEAISELIPLLIEK
ncbi:HAD family hydrolase [Niameybacter massiliensis]|uniref:HAD family hydrolase n=1 Tax=Holtiella tumoricola TaxID=3018743 RepID=A0AA42DKS8_9FIRM|nr:HAD family hydrolase [Holtiella tumoricola]MDA3730675.1 HAD family hydrolase [Holtiella tumoricola]